MSSVTNARNASDNNGTLLYKTTGVSPLRILTIVSLAFALGSAMLAALLLDSSVRVGNAISFGERAIWAGALLTAFCGFFAAVWLYERRVAAKIVLANDGKSLQVSTPTLFGMTERQIPLDDLLTAQYHDGDTSGEEAVSPPWLWVKVRGTSSFVVPLAGMIPNKDRLISILSARH